jgi:dTMP kinase
MQQQQGPRGAFVLFEGVDRCGKSTQTSLLAKSLEGQGVSLQHCPLVPDFATQCSKSSRAQQCQQLLTAQCESLQPTTRMQVAVESWNFPDRKNTVTGHAINEYLAGKQDHNDRAIHLLFSANRWEKRQAAGS